MKSAVCFLIAVGVFALADASTIRTAHVCETMRQLVREMPHWAHQMMGDVCVANENDCFPMKAVSEIGAKRYIAELREAAACLSNHVPVSRDVMCRLIAEFPEKSVYDAQGMDLEEHFLPFIETFTNLFEQKLNTYMEPLKKSHGC